MKKKNAKAKTAVKATVKKVAKVAKVIVPVIVPSNKELVGDYLEGKTFLNSRKAFRDFKDQAAKTVKISQAYFYTLFKMFGKREKKSEGLASFVNVELFATPMCAYKAYTKSLAEGIKGVSFAYFLNVWKRTLGITGSVRVKKVAKAKVVKATRTIKLTINMKQLSAREILAEVAKLDASNAILAINTKNKTKIVKEATNFLTVKGYKVTA